MIEPMEALGVPKVPDGDWRLEILFDGDRALAAVEKGRIRLWSRTRQDLTADFPEITAALATLDCASVVLDGEIVAVDAHGRSRLHLLQHRKLSAVRPLILYYVFDLLALDGRSLLDKPIETRRRLLDGVGRQAGRAVQLSPVFIAQPAQLLAECRKRDLAGIVAKAAGSRYEPGARSGQWLKCRLMHEQEFVIGGFTPPLRHRPHFGALLVGYFHEGRLHYAGRVAAGFDVEWLASLAQRFARLAVRTCPFKALLPPGAEVAPDSLEAATFRRATWVRPELVCQVRFAEWTYDSRLRNPVFLGLRIDKRPQDVGREAAPPGG